MMMISTAYNKNQNLKLRNLRDPHKKLSIFSRPHIDIHVEPSIAISAIFNMLNK